MTRYIAVLAAFTLSACGGQAGTPPAGNTAPTQAAKAPPDAPPSDVYLMYHERQVQLLSALEPLDEKAEALHDAGRTDEARQVWDEVLALLDPEIVKPFVSRARMQEWTAMPVSERNTVFGQKLQFTPSRVEVQSETVEGDRAALGVRGYFDELMADHGWRAGTVSLVREEDGWKVDAESWGDPGSGEPYAPSGRFEVSGEADGVAASADVSPPMWGGYGGGWAFSLSSESIGYVVTFHNIPDRLEPGEYPLAESSTIQIPGDADPATLELPPSVIFAENSDFGDDRWDEDVTGTLTVEAVESGRMSGRFEFAAAQSFIGEGVTVRGSFRYVEIPQWVPEQVPQR